MCFLGNILMMDATLLICSLHMINVTLLMCCVGDILMMGVTLIMCSPGIILMMAVTLLAELLPMRWRHLGPVIPSWPLGVMCFAGVAALLENWAYLHIVCAVLSGLFVLGFL